MLSFYKNDEKSRAVDALMDGAKAIIDRDVASGESEKRDIAWFRLNI